MALIRFAALPLALAHSNLIVPRPRNALGVAKMGPPGRKCPECGSGTFWAPPGCARHYASSAFGPRKRLSHYENSVPDARRGLRSGPNATPSVFFSPPGMRKV